MAYRRSSTDIHTLLELKTFRTELRLSLTPAEARLWTILKNSKLDGRKFRRQYSVGKYILDFYCASEKLAIELDGAGHYTGRGIENDRERTSFIEQFGINVIRFENKRVFEDEEWVLDNIRAHFGWVENHPVTQKTRATPPS